VSRGGSRSLALLAPVILLACSSSKSAPPDAGLCRTKTDCAAGELCTADGRCVSGVECGRDSDCAASDARKQCDPKTLSCVFLPGFADDCDPARPCAFGQFCSPLLGMCLTSSTSRDCTRRAQCPAGQICDRTPDKCVRDTGCYGPAFCEPGEVCDLDTHRCHALAVECTACNGGSCANGSSCNTATGECLASGASPACRPGENCDPLGRCVQCENSSQCGSGLYCNTALGKCESNVQCADDPSNCPTSGNVQCVMCVPPQICDLVSKSCQAPPTVCVDDTACSGDEYCDKTQNPPICVRRVPDCVPDQYAPNGAAAASFLLDPAHGPIYPNAKLCPGTEAWYRVDVAAGTYLTVDLRFHASDGNIDLDLYLADGVTLVATSRGTTDNQRVEVDVGAAVTFLLRAYYPSPAIQATPYSIVVTRDPSSICVTAPGDTSSHDTLGTARPIASDTPYEGRICTAQPNWFVVQSVPAGSELTATLDFTNALGNLDLELYRADSPVPILRSATDADQEQIAYGASFPGDYYYRVLGRAADSNVYTFRVNVRSTTTAVCLDDRFEPDNTAATAVLAPDRTGSTALGLSICAGDEDWYHVPLLANEALTAEVGWSAAAELTLKMYAPGASSTSAAPLREADPMLGTPREFLSYRAPIAGDYRIRVAGLGADQISPYELRIQHLPAPGACVPDLAEASNNHGQFDAYPLRTPPSRLDELTLCNGESDWFKVTLLGGYTNIIRLQYVADDAELDFTVFDGGGRMLGSTSAGGSTGPVQPAKELSINVGGAGLTLVYLEVTRTSGGNGSYNLTVDLEPFYSCKPDRFDPNNAPDLAKHLAVTATTSSLLLGNLSLCASTGEEDWYTFTVPAAGTRMDVYLGYQFGDLFLELFSPGGTHRACLDQGADQCYSDGVDRLVEHVSFTATTATAAYYLRVGSIWSDPTLPVKPPNIDTPYYLNLEFTPP
jgi:hypothetical protein